MSPGRPDLRLDAPVLEPSEDLVQRLAATARASRVPPAARRHRLAIVVASFLGVSAISVGGAWAVGAIDVPGVPSSPLKPPEITPAPRAPVERPGGSGADSGTGPAAELPPGVGEPADRVLESGSGAKREPREAAPKDANPGQGETRREAKGDNGKHRGQDNDDPPGRANQGGNGRAQEKKDREDRGGGQGNAERRQRERGGQGD